jgi:hypothetical protein
LDQGFEIFAVAGRDLSELDFVVTVFCKSNDVGGQLRRRAYLSEMTQKICVQNTYHVEGRANVSSELFLGNVSLVEDGENFEHFHG